MNAKKLHLTIFTLVALTLLVLAGAVGLLVGRAQAPRAKPTPIPTVVAPLPTQEPIGEPTPGSASISGRVWHDLCTVASSAERVPITPSGGCVRVGDGYWANGLLEAGEPGVGGVLIQLGAGACPASGLATATTDTTGAYAFTGLNAGTYCVSADVSSPQNASLLPGSWTAPAGADGSVVGYTVTLQEDERRREVNFGWDYQFLPVPEPLAPGPPPTPACTNKAAFISDVTIPDNTYVSPGESFVKTWRLRNIGTCTWTTEYALAFVDGHRMGGPASIPLRGPVAPGEVVDLSVALTAPAGFGTYEGKWQLRSADGDLFGTGRNADGVFWMRIVVGHTPSGWRGEYYDDRNLAGDPALVRNDDAVNFNWGTGTPAAGLPADGFSVRWTRIVSMKGGAYRFHAYSDDGVRVWLDGELIIDQWHEATGATYTAERTLSVGNHTLRVEYYEDGGAARIRFWWEHLGEFPQWRGEFFANIGLAGDPKLTRNDAAINFNWGHYAPAAGLPADGFSVRWRRVLMFEEGLYRFHALVDDGVRMWVDGVPVINAWHEGGVRELTADHWLSAGNHTLRIEYFEQTGDALIRVWWEKLAWYPDWKGEYWSNRTLSGSPALVRNDATVDFNWGWGAPAAGLPTDSFSVRWTRTVEFDAATYRFHVVVDDGARVWLDDRLILDTWRDGAVREVTTDYTLVRGAHNLRVEFYERTGEARIHVWWEKVLSPPYPDWKGEYWSNRKLSGNPALVRNDKVLDFRWDTGAPAVGLPTDNFSARWSRKVTFEPGVYRFHAWADDGIRVYMDGNLVLDEWHDSSGDEVYVADLTLRDQHRLVVEYYERGGNALVKFWWKRIGDWPAPTPTPNRPPVAVDDVVTTDEDTPVDVNVLANDLDPDGDVLTVSSYHSSSTRGGTVKCTGGGACTYTPPANFNGTDTFGYTVGDGKGGSASATVTVVVNLVNDPPVAVDDAATTNEGVPVELDVLANDLDPDGDVLSVSGYDTTGAQGGTVKCTSAGVCTYTPPAVFTGTDTFGYTVSDGKGGSASVIVAVTVNPVNNPPSVDVRINEILPTPTMTGTRMAQLTSWTNCGSRESGRCGLID